MPTGSFIHFRLIFVRFAVLWNRSYFVKLTTDQNVSFNDICIDRAA